MLYGNRVIKKSTDAALRGVPPSSTGSCSSNYFHGIFGNLWKINPARVKVWDTLTFPDDGRVQTACQKMSSLLNKPVLFGNSDYDELWDGVTGDIMHKPNGDISRDPMTFDTISNYRTGLLHYHFWNHYEKRAMSIFIFCDE